jgi:hypothetical protein
VCRMYKDPEDGTLKPVRRVLPEYEGGYKVILP